MKSLTTLAIALLASFMASCYSFPAPQAEDTRNLDPFDGIGISLHADVFYTQGNAHEIRIEGNENDVSDVITEVRDGFLQVRYDNQRIRRSKLTIHITSRELESVKISGSSRFEVNDPLSSDEMDLAVSGSGTIEFRRLSTDEMDVKVSGSGSVLLDDGAAHGLGITISGSGDLRAEDFEVSECSAALSGSGSVRITVKDELDARISGSGRIYYKGDPQVNSRSSGSGKVVSL